MRTSTERAFGPQTRNRTFPPDSGIAPRSLTDARLSAGGVLALRQLLVERRLQLAEHLLDLGRRPREPFVERVHRPAEVLAGALPRSPPLRRQPKEERSPVLRIGHS